MVSKLGWRSLIYLMLGIASPVLATEAEISAICDVSSAAAAAERGMPADVLYTITLTETGRSRDGRLRPWPWTVNMEGRGFWFDTREEAMTYVQARFDEGARSFDVGCFQINYKWHHQHFDSIEEMFDPMANARYAARFLSELYDESADWTKSAGMYHSRNETYASRYRARFTRIRATLGDMPETPQIVLPTVMAAARFPGVRHAFLSSAPMVAASPYGSRNITDTTVQVGPAAVMGSLASGMLGGQTVTLLTGTNGALF
ncbi:MAG: lytic transglycosylase domain-containing protein [Rhodobacteraceae bacterium]|nr:lytic transglycosylase domain-containing protein [Paracoccaceae bacterium]